ncbi:hypothetical protein lerEdw1_015941, partial [Lerista edwardsae]
MHRAGRATHALNYGIRQSGGNVVSRDGHEKVTILQECPAWPGALRGQLGEGVVLARGEKGDLGCPGAKGAKNSKQLLDKGVVQSGWYTLWGCSSGHKNPAEQTGVLVASLQVFRRLTSSSVGFYRDWGASKRGFGSRLPEFWLVNDNRHLLTSLGEHELRVDLTDFHNSSTFAKYSVLQAFRRIRSIQAGAQRLPWGHG